MSRTSVLGRTGEAAAWAISAVGCALSFTAKMQFPGAHGFTTWEVWAWPATSCPVKANERPHTAKDGATRQGPPRGRPLD